MSLSTSTVFDILPPLYSLLRRLLGPPDSPEPPESTESIIKQLPREVGVVRIRIQKARAAVDELPDMHRSLAQQLREIDELEASLEGHL